MVMNSFISGLSGKQCTSAPVLNDTLSGRVFLVGSFFLSTLIMPCNFLLTCKISAEKSVNSVTRVSLHITSYLFLAIFKMLFLSLTFDNLVI